MNVCPCLILGSTPWLQIIALLIWSRIQFVSLDHQRSTCSLYHAPQLLCSRILFVSLDHWRSTCSLYHAPQLLCSRILFVSDNFQFPVGRGFEPATFGSKCMCHTNCATEVVVQVGSRVTLILKIMLLIMSEIETYQTVCQIIGSETKTRLDQQHPRCRCLGRVTDP